jgi:hypothetical protein
MMVAMNYETPRQVPQSCGIPSHDGTRGDSIFP